MEPGGLHSAVELGGATFVPIEPDMLGDLATSVARSGTMLWAAYPPFLLSYDASPARAVLVGEIDGAAVVLIRRKIKGRDHLDLVLPPLGPDPVAALDALTPHLVRFNGLELETRMLWADLPTVRSAAGWRATPFEREYLYRRDDLLSRRGEGFRTLRKRLNRCDREYEPTIRPFTPGDRNACVALLRRWQDAREEIVAPVFDFGYTKAAVDLAAERSAPMLLGIVVEIDRTVKAFAFGGEMKPGLGQFFLLKSDPSIPGLAETTRVAFIERIAGCNLVNDAGDLGRPGLRQHKETLRPVGFVMTWKMTFVA